LNGNVLNSGKAGILKDAFTPSALLPMTFIIIVEKVIKHPDRPQATRCFNYPYPSIEEAMCNAVYHRSYEIREPMTCRIFPDKLTISSLPGPDRSISDEDIKKYTLVPNRYRNRRIGEFLKELELAEGRGTGIPKILKESKNNGSPKPKLIYDEDRSYFTIEFPLHPAFKGIKSSRKTFEQSRSGVELATQSATQSSDPVSRLLEVLGQGEMSPSEIRKKLALKHRPTFRKNYLHPALIEKLIEPTIPDKPNSRLQKYRLTEKGRKLAESRGD
jgi:ATP-dependent DNA helicase RecG